MKSFIGLSPLARGTPLAELAADIESRFIPAGAGNTLFFTFCHLYGPVYPRWRGEHQPSPSGLDGSHGLSPLARGTLGDIYVTNQAARFIPAGAGNTTNSQSFLNSTAVYPRWRGEHAGRHGRPVDPARFIPAGAGNTHASSDASPK